MPTDGPAVVTATNPFSSALSLIGNLARFAVLYLLASGEFVAAARSSSTPVP